MVLDVEVAGEACSRVVSLIPAAVFTLVRNLGNAAGISVMEAVLAQQSQVAHAGLTQNLTPGNPMAAPLLNGNMEALNDQITQQASMVAYIDVFHFMFLTTLAAIPLVLLLRKPADQIVAVNDALIE